MRRILMWVSSTVTVVVLAFGYHTSTNSAAAGASTTSSSTTTRGASSSPAASDPPSSSTPTRSPGTSTSSGSTSTKTYTGAAASTRYGPVQVKITVVNGKIATVVVPQSPNSSPRDVQIADRALPVLVQETVAAQSAKIDMVSGATYTSDGYLTSLQSALDQAGM